MAATDIVRVSASLSAFVPDTAKRNPVQPCCRVEELTVCATIPPKLTQEAVMKRFIVASLMLCSVLMFAQGARTQDAAPKTHSMTGCLRAGDAAGSFMLTDLEKGPKTVGIVSSDA